MKAEVVVPNRTAVVIDRHHEWLELVEAVLATVAVDVVGTAPSLREGTQLIEEREPELVIVEAPMEESAAALGWLSETAARFPDIKMIAAGAQEPVAIRDVLTAGADAYVVKSPEPLDLAAAVRQMDERSFFLSTESGAEGEHTAEPGLGLTKRELEILRLASQGLSNGTIAKRLWVTEQTVKFHLANTYRKLGVSNRTAAARQAQLRGLLTGTD